MLSMQISVQNGTTLLCGERGGNVRGEQGHGIRWVSDQPFTLEFFRVAEEVDKEAPVTKESRQPPVELDGWPFSEPARAQDVRWPVEREFRAVLKDGCGVYKYYITVGNLRLDPIIIVDRVR